jgi:hypothetical protein
MDLLVIVENSTLTHERYFPFELRLEYNLTVDIHSHVDKLVRLATGRRSDHKGWYFNIQGKYRSSEAEEALRKAKEDSETIGLHAALKEWLIATHEK